MDVIRSRVVKSTRRRPCLALCMVILALQVLMMTVDYIFPGLPQDMVDASLYSSPIDVTTVREDDGRRDVAQCWGPPDALLSIVSFMMFEKEQQKRYRNVPDCMRPNRIEYARYHGARYCEYTQVLTTDEDLAHKRSKMEDWNGHKPSKFSRYIAVPNILLNSEYVLYIDADAFFVDKSISALNDWALKYPSKDLIVSQSGWYSKLGGLNSGVFVARNTTWLRTFFQRILDDDRGLGSDQLTMWELINENEAEFGSKVEILPLGNLQTNGWRPPILWTLFGIDVSILPWVFDRTYIAHWTCGPDERKYDAIRRYMNCECVECEDKFRHYLGFSGFGGLCLR